MNYPLTINGRVYTHFSELAELINTSPSPQSDEGKGLLQVLLDGVLQEKIQVWAKSNDNNEPNEEAQHVLEQMNEFLPLNEDTFSLPDSVLMERLVSCFGSDYVGRTINIHDYIYFEVIALKHGEEDLPIDSQICRIKDRAADITMSVELTFKKTLNEIIYFSIKANGNVSNEVAISFGQRLEKKAHILKIKEYAPNLSDSLCLIAREANEEIILWTKKLIKITDSENGHDYVDLGLPSGLKWAICNVGATTPEGYGDYFAWGETSPKNNYDWSTYKYCNGSYLTSTLTKYNTDESSRGTVDNKSPLELSDDAARVNWGGKWRMPTIAEQDELRKNCTWTRITLNGVNGYKVTSRTNTNSIFLPAAGYRSGTSVFNDGSDGYYWSGSFTKRYPDRAYILYFDSDRVRWRTCSRDDGCTVRAVCP